MGRGFNDIPDRSQRDNVRESDLFEIFPLSKKAKGNWVSLRFLPIDLLPIKKHWVKIMGGKDKSKELKIPRMCVSFDPDNQREPLRGMKCPYCELVHGNDESGASAQIDFKWHAQAIVRDEQTTKPRKLPKLTNGEKKTGKKDKSSDSWTPVFVVPLTNSMAGQIRQMGERNFAMVKDKKSGQKIKTAFPITDKKYGIDVDIKYVPENPPTNRYVMEKGERTPLTEEENEYLTWDFDDWEGIFDSLGRLDEKDALADFKKMDVIGSSTDSDDDEDEDDDMSLGRNKGKKSSSKTRSRLSDDDEDDEDDEDEDDRPSKKKKSSKLKSKTKKSSSKRLLDDDEDDEDEDEDDRPSKKKKSSKLKSKSSKSSKAKRALDEDEDEDEKPKKKKKSSKEKEKSSKSVKSSKKKKSSDEDDAPKKKKKKK